MKLISEKVEHKKFGIGVVTETNHDKIKVQFQIGEEDKTFQYPESFGAFLKAVNPAVQEDVMEDYQKRQKEIEHERDLIRKKRDAIELAEKMAISDAKKKTTRKSTTRKTTTKAKTIKSKEE